MKLNDKRGDGRRSMTLESPRDFPSEEIALYSVAARLKNRVPWCSRQKRASRLTPWRRSTQNRLNAYIFSSEALKNILHRKEPHRGKLFILRNEACAANNLDRIKHLQTVNVNATLRGRGAVRMEQNKEFAPEPFGWILRRR